MKTSNSAGWGGEERNRAGSVFVCVEAPSWPHCALVLDAVLWVGRDRQGVHVMYTDVRANRLSISLFFCYAPGFGVTWEITL